MRVRTHLRTLRGRRSLSEAEKGTGIARGRLSQFERGFELPRDSDRARMEAFYGDAADWYPPSVARVVAADRGVCPGCGEPLDPGLPNRRRYHGEPCRSLARAAHAGVRQVPE